MVTKRDDNRRRSTTNRVNIEQSASGRLEGRVLQYQTREQESSIRREKYKNANRQEKTRKENNNNKKRLQQEKKSDFNDKCHLVLGFLVLPLSLSDSM